MGMNHAYFFLTINVFTAGQAHPPKADAIETWPGAQNNESD